MRRLSTLPGIVVAGAVMALLPGWAHGQSPDEAPSSAPRGADTPAVDRSEKELLLRVLEELASVQDRLNHLENKLEAFKSDVAQELRAENQRLRRAIRERFGPGGVPPPDVPFPEQELVREVLEAESAPPPRGEFGYEVVREWGRSPEEARALNESADSLKGMVLAVPGWSEDGQLVELARGLRADLDSYDNINIEVFNDEESAKKFAEHGVSNPAHRVISISKFADSGRDVILLIRGNEIREVPLEAEAAAS